MKLTFKNEKLVIIDDFLAQDDFAKIWQFVQKEEYASPITAGWIKVWRQTDKTPLGSKDYWLTKMPYGSNEINLLMGRFIELATVYSEIAGKNTENWQDLVLRSYLYSRSSKLSWHNDSEVYSAALTYYVHPHWGSTWGGELLVPEVPLNFKGMPPAGQHLSHKWEDEFLSEIGYGQYVVPKPNRVVLMKGGTFHSVARIDDDAGDNTRCSIVGFFTKNTLAEETKKEQLPKVTTKPKIVVGTKK